MSERESLKQLINDMLIIAEPVMHVYAGGTRLAQFHAAIIAAEAELAKPEAEPVAWMNPDPEMDQVVTSRIRPLFGHYIRDCTTPLYASPRPMQRLTDESLQSLMSARFPDPSDAVLRSLTEFSCAIMDAMIEKNK